MNLDLGGNEMNLEGASWRCIKLARVFMSPGDISEAFRSENNSCTSGKAIE